MLKRLYIHNYKCYQNFEFNLENLHDILLLGENGVGKSTIGAVLDILRRIGGGEHDVERLVRLSDRFDHGPDAVVRIEATFSSELGDLSYGLALELPPSFTRLRVREETLQLNGETVFSRAVAQVDLNNLNGGKSSFLHDWHQVVLPSIFTQPGVTPPAVEEIRSVLRSIIVLHPQPEQMVSQSDSLARELARDASNLATWTEAMVAENHEAYSLVVDWYRQLSPDFSGFRSTPRDRQLLIKYRREDRDIEVPFDALSDGEKVYFLAAVLMAYNETISPLICYWDEPDNFMMMREIGGVMSSLRKSFAGRGQLIVAAHSDETIMKFAKARTFCLRRLSHLEPTLPIKSVTQLEEEGLEIGDYRTSIVTGDLFA